MLTGKAIPSARVRLTAEASDGTLLCDQIGTLNAVNTQRGRSYQINTALRVLQRMYPNAVRWSVDNV